MAVTNTKPYFLRPIEHTTLAGGDITLSTNGAVTLPSGTYSNIGGLLNSLVLEALDAGATGFDASIGTESNDFKIALEVTTSQTLTWNNTALRDALGYAGNFTISSTPTEADYTPEYVWIPTFLNSDAGGFVKPQRDLFKGQMSQDGTLAGAPIGPNTVYKRDMGFNMELGTNVSRELSTSAIEDVRTLEYFMEHSRTAYPTNATSKNPKGFWFIPNITDFTAVVTSATEQWTAASSGINFDYTSSPNKWVFCMPDVGGFNKWDSAPGLPASRLRYNIALSFNTSTPPTFKHS